MKKPKMIKCVLVSLCLWVVVHSGVVQQSQKQAPEVDSGFCSRNPTNVRCHSTDRRDHPDLPPPLTPRQDQLGESNQEYWKQMAKEIVKQHLARSENKNRAKNIVFFLGDGMGIQSVTAARMLLGDENKKLSFEEFPYTGSVKTYCVDTQVADSACTATAYLSGVKTNEGMAGINARVKRYECDGHNDNTAYTESIAKWAQVAKKATGVVTTTRVTHASPSGLYAHTANRDWETDYCVQFKDCADGFDVEDNLSGCDASKIPDISQQLVRGDVGSNFNVILGGGRRGFFDSSVKDELGVNGQRTDGLDLISEWANDGKKNKKVVKVREDLLAVDAKQTDYLLGLFGLGSHLKYHLQAEQERVTNEPTLWEMTEKALEILSKNENGFFLFVEGGKIDLAHHDTFARAALRETIQFEETIRKVREKFSEEDTLIIVTADHSHTMSISGYPVSGCSSKCNGWFNVIFSYSLRTVATISSGSPGPLPRMGYGRLLSATRMDRPTTRTLRRGLDERTPRKWTRVPGILSSLPW